MSEKKKFQLGMPIGTASGRLKKLLLFSMAQRLNETNCYRCGSAIQTPDEFTVDHKTDWLDENPNLFWDLSNIAFSHAACNVRGSQLGPSHRRKVGPAQTSWCAGHEAFLPIEQFRSHARSWNGLYKYCRDCESEKRKTYRNR